jgi:hypothetical protein
VPVSGGYHTYPEMAAAGLWTTPSDLARAAIAVQHAAAGAGTLLPAARTREMLSVHAGSWGLGFTLGGAADSLVFSHGGSNEGFRAQFTAFADRGDGVFIMTNSDNGGMLLGEVTRAVADVYGWSLARPAEREALRVEPAWLARFAGDYDGSRLGELLRVSVSAAADRLIVHRDGMAPVELRPLIDDVFASPWDATEWRFTRGDDGAVLRVDVRGGAVPVRLERVR